MSLLLEICLILLVAGSQSYIMVGARFDCGNGLDVLERYKCDGVNDCVNGADELNCTETSRPAVVLRFWPTQARFDCGNGRNVPEIYKCDGDNDCGNGADEVNCTQTSRPAAGLRFLSTRGRDEARFDCGNGRDVPERYKCDGDNDCGNGADELNCTESPRSIRDPSGFRHSPCSMRRRFYCGVHGQSRLQLIDNSLVCDGKNDCENGNDERNCGTEAEVRAPVNEEPSIQLNESMSIQSPNYPQEYPNSFLRIWKVITAPGHRIQLEFNEFRLEDGGDCGYDKLEIYDGDELLGRFCGRVLPGSLLTSSNRVLLKFLTDSSVTWEGFDVMISPVCGGTQNANASENIIVSHPKYGFSHYDSGLKCDWIITSPEGSRVEIRFNNFKVGGDILEDVEMINCKNGYSGNCIQYDAEVIACGNDYVDVFDGLSDSSNKIGRFCGNQIPPTITSGANELLLRFVSGDEDHSDGFKVTYREI